MLRETFKGHFKGVKPMFGITLTLSNLISKNYLKCFTKLVKLKTDSKTDVEQYARERQLLNELLKAFGYSASQNYSQGHDFGVWTFHPLRLVKNVFKNCTKENLRSDHVNKKYERTQASEDWRPGKRNGSIGVYMKILDGLDDLVKEMRDDDECNTRLVQDMRDLYL